MRIECDRQNITELNINSIKQKIMKKILLSLMMLLAFAGTACADEYAHNGDVLPQAAKSVIKKNFKADVSLVKIDKDFGRVSEYDVVLTDGSEISFDRDGNWKEVETNAAKAVPAAFVLQPIRDYVAKNHKGLSIVGVDKKRNGYDITLSNGIDMEFNKAGQFIRYDD